MITMSARTALHRPALRAFFRHAYRWLGQRFARPAPRLSDRLARDVGLSTSEIERMRFEWPSRTSTHPML